MVTYCSQCNINWLLLWTSDGEDQEVEFCPVCKTDHHLQPGNDTVAYIKCPITGIIKDPVSGMAYMHPVIETQIIESKTISTRETNDHRIDREDSAIDAYLETGSKSSYHQTIKKVK